MTTSGDAPWLDCAYKLQEYDGRPCRKRSEGKHTWPGRKQVYRRRGPDGRLAHDIVTLAGDTQPGEALLVPIMRAGQRIVEPSPLHAIRARVETNVGALPDRYRRLDGCEPYDVRISPALTDLAMLVDREG
jgi:nicotinate phosphoribosyltransferase